MKKPTEALLEFDHQFADMLLGSKCDLFKGTDGDLYFSSDTPHGPTTYTLDSEEGRAVLTDMFDREAQGHIITKQEMERGARLAHAKILFKPKREVFLRVGKDADFYYLDLHTEPKKYVKFDKHKWEIVSTVPVHFREGQGQLPMDLEPGMSDNNAGLQTLRRLLTVNDAQWKCLLPLLVSYLLADIQHPLLLLTGEQNSGKSTFLEIVKTLIDPNTAPIGGDVPDPRNLFIKVNSMWLPTFDNLSRLDDKQQDGLCQIITGGTYQTRRLYSDTGQVTITCKNPVILAGINNVANRGDIASRAVLFELHSIDRQSRLISAETITKRISATAPSILRALLNLTVAVLRVYDEVGAPPNVRPAAYGIIGRAVEKVFLWTPGSFEHAYHITRQSLHDDVVEKSAVIGALLQYLQQFEAAGQHEQNATTLLAILSTGGCYADESVVRSNLWPKAPNAFGRILQNCAPAIRKQYGWDCVLDRNHTGRFWKFTYNKPKREEVKAHSSLRIAPLVRPQAESLGQSVRRLRKEAKRT